MLSSKPFLAAASVCLLSMPASAGTVTDVFTGVIAPADVFNFPTTTDNSPNACGGPCFGGAVVGDAFTLTLTMSVPSGMTSGQIQGGSDPIYGGTTPLTMTLTINGVPLTLTSSFANSYNNGNTSTIGNTGVADYNPNGTDKELEAQAYVYSSQSGGIQRAFIDLDVIAPGSSLFGQLASTTCPTGCLGTLIGTEFGTYIAPSVINGFMGDNELLALDITAINPVMTPLPATLPLFATGLGALGLLGWRRKRKAQTV